MLIQANTSGGQRAVTKNIRKLNEIFVENQIKKTTNPKPKANTQHSETEKLIIRFE